MTPVTMLFLLVAGTALQSLIPAVPWLGYATAPLLGSIVLYYALYRGGLVMLTAAIIAGLFQDSSSLIPLGYSSFAFAAVALVVERYRDLMVLQSAFTHIVLTAAVHAVVTALLMMLMLYDGVIAWPAARLLWKIPGAVLLGMVTGPLVIAAAYALEEKTGIIQGDTERYGATRSFYGIG
jgi:cell shape-determining protein MreD